MMPTFELNMNLNMRAVTVIGIIHGIMSRPRMDLARGKPALKSSASAKPMANWKTRQQIVNTKVFPRERWSTPLARSVW